MSTSPDMEVPSFDPVSAEVAVMRDTDDSRLTELRTLLEQHKAAARAEGNATLAMQHAAAVGERVKVLETNDARIEGELKAIHGKLEGIDKKLANSPTQQFLYSLVALSALALIWSYLWDRYLGAGAG